jgi:exonuclease SbcC
MITSIKLTNFKGYKDTTEIFFDEGVNSIVGSTDAGKSALISAIFWVVFNRPLGDEMMRNPDDTTTVTLRVKNGSKVYDVSRRRGKGNNIYKVKPLGEPSVYYSGFGSSVPDEISAIFNLSEINFQGQHDAPFMVSSSPREAGALLNEVTDLSSIDRTISNINRIARNEKEAVEDLKVKRGELQKQVVSFDWIDEYEKGLETVQEIYQKTNETVSEIAVLKVYIDNLETLNSTREEVLAKVALKEDLAYLLSLDAEIAQDRDEIFRLKKFLNSVSDLREKQFKVANALCQLKKDMFDSIGEVCPLCGQEIL